MNYSNDNKATYVFLIPFFILILELFSTAAYAIDAAALFEKTLISYEVEGVSLSTQLSALEDVLTSAGYKLKKKSQKRQQSVYSFVRGKGKTSSSVKVSVTPDSIIKSIRVSLRDANIESLMNSEKARFEKSFSDFSDLCQSHTNTFKCQSFTAADRISISMKSSKKAITYDIASKASTKAKKITEKHQAEVRVQELALIEAARQEELRKVRLAEQSQEQVRAQERALIDSSRQEKLRKVRLAEQQQQQAEFAKKMAGHPCYQYDVNNHKQVLACLQTLEMASVKSKNNDLPSVWVEEGACQVMKENLGLNLKSMGLREEAMNSIPGCKLFAELHKEKYGTDVYWSGCIDKPEWINAQYIFDCIDFTHRTSPKYIHEFLPAFMRKFSAAGHTADNQSGAELYAKMQGVLALRNQQALKLRKEQKDKQRALRAEEDKRIQEYYYKTYYEKTPEREKSKFSDAERRLMKNNRLVVPASYAPPSAQEIRLAVIRSIFDRLNGRGIETVITDGHALFLIKKMLFIRRGLGVELHLEEVKNLSCHKKTNSVGYMCRYNMGQTSRLDPISKKTLSSSDPVIQGLRGGFNLVLSHFQTPSSRFQTNWFVLTDSGWKQPYTDEQIATINQNNERARKNAEEYQKESERIQQSFDNWLR